MGFWNNIFRRPATGFGSAKSFLELPLSSLIVQRLDRLPQSVTVPTDVQVAAAKAIAASGRSDVTICSPRGSGKTLSYVLPALSAIDVSRRAVQAIVVVPTLHRASIVTKLCRDLTTVSSTSSGHTGGISVMQASRRPDASMVRLVRSHTPHVLVATPQALAHLVSRQAVDPQAATLVVLEDASTTLAPFYNAFTTMGLGSAAQPAGGDSPGCRLVATDSHLTTDVERLLKARGTSVTRVEISESPDLAQWERPRAAMEALPANTTHYVLHVLSDLPTTANGKAALLRNILAAFKPPGSTLVVDNDREVLEPMANNLRISRLTARALYSQTSTLRRLKVLKEIDGDAGQEHNNRLCPPVLITAEDTAYGLHLESLTHLINMGMPRDRMSYALRARALTSPGLASEKYTRYNLPPKSQSTLGSAEKNPVVITVLTYTGRAQLARLLSWERDLCIPLHHVKLEGGKVVPLELGDYTGIPLPAQTWDPSAARRSSYGSFKQMAQASAA